MQSRIKPEQALQGNRDLIENETQQIFF